MKKPTLVTHGGISLDLSQVKSFHIDTYNPHKKSNILRIEMKGRFEYLRHPETGEYEKVFISDFSEHPYADYSVAEAHRDEWVEIWQEYLEE